VNIHAPTENKIDDVKGSFYEEFESVFDRFAKYHKKILLGDLNAKVGRKDIFKPRIGNDSLDEISNDNGVTEVNFATSKNLKVKSTTCPYSSVLDVRSFRAADCYTNHCLVVEKVRSAVKKQKSQRFHMEIQS
jgi:hypothetical protein